MVLSDKGIIVNSFTKFFSSAFLRLTLLLLINIAIIFGCDYFGYVYIYSLACVLLALISIFFLSGREERDSYKVTVFLAMFVVPFWAIGYAVALKDRKGNKKIKKEWSDIIYRNRKSVFQSNETMANLKAVNTQAYKTCNYLVDTVGMPCFQNASVKYYSFGEAYFKDLIDEINNAQNYVLLECYKIVPGKLWKELFDTLRLKARQGVSIKLVYDDAVCTKFISREDFLKMQNHGIETVPFNRYKPFAGSFVNCRNFKRLTVIDGKVGFFGGFNIDDEYVQNIDLTNATKDCGVRIMGEAVKNLIVMFFEDYQFASKKVINLQDYFADSTPAKTKDWILPYSTNPVSLDHTNKNILLSLINNAKDNIAIVTTYLALDDELKNALIVNAKSGIKVRLIFSSEKVSQKIKTLSRSYFYDLIKEGIEVYEYKGGKMTTRLIMIDNNSALISTNNLDSQNTYKHFNAGIYLYGDSVILMYNDIREIINGAQLVTIKDMQKRKLSEKISACWSKFIALFR